MKYSNYDIELNKKLFNQNCINGEKMNDVTELQKIVQNLISSIGWEELVTEWYKYLKENVQTRTEAFNFATWLFIYDFGKCNVKDPYPFLALLYKKMELESNPSDELENRFDTPYDRFLDIYVDVLLSSHIIDIGKSDFIKPEDDERLLLELNKI